MLSTYLRRTGKALRLRGALAHDPTAQILHVLLVALVGYLLLELTLTLPFSPRKPAIAAGMVFEFLFLLTPLILLRRGSLRMAGLVYLSGYWLLSTLTIILNGGIHSVGIVLYLVLPISAAWLLGYHAALVNTGICLGSLLIMAVLEMNGRPMPRYFPGTPMGIWVTVVAAMIMAAVPIVRILQILKGALVQSESAKEALRESEERFRNMADTAPVMIWVSGSDKLCTFFNKVWLDFTGRTMEQELGEGWAEVVHPDDLDRCTATYSASFDARRSFQTECRLRRADGEYRWVLEDGIPRFEQGGVFVGYIGSCLDITDLKRAHEEDLTKQKLETVGMLAGGIAHDFNNLLGGVLAHSELALAELASGSNPTDELERIRDGAIRGAEIVRQLMIYAGQESEALELVDVSAIVKDMLELLKVSVSKHVSVEADLGKQLPVVRANPSQIRQVVMNLFYNASEAIGDQDGVIRVTTRRVIVGGDSPVATSEPLAKGDYVQLEISDTGRGMTPEVQARIFDTFFTTKIGGNHGLGLAGVQKIVERLHGTIRLSSAPGKGTAFQILLPSDESMIAAVHTATDRANDEELAARGKTVLIVEDEDLLRQGVSKMLRKKGLSVLEASDGYTALDLIRTQKDDMDLLLMDITIPGASSREVYEEAERLRPDLPVIVTSANSEEIAAASLAAGIQHFLRKPYRFGDLIVLIRETLSSRARAQAFSIRRGGR